MTENELFLIIITPIIIIIACISHFKKRINKEFFDILNKHIKDFRDNPEIVTDFLNKYPDIFDLYQRTADSLRLLTLELAAIRGCHPTCKWTNYKYHFLHELRPHGAIIFINLNNKHSRLITDLFVAKFKFEHLFWETISDIPESIGFIRSMPDLFCFSGVEEKPFWAIGKPHKLEMFGRPLYIYSNETDILGLSAVYVGLFVNDKDRLPKHLRYYIKAVLKLQKSMVK